MMFSRRIFVFALACTVFGSFSHKSCHAQPRNVTWHGNSSDFWDDNNNWSDDDGIPGVLQPFDIDAVFIPSGTPVIQFLEGINTLDVDPGAGIAMNSVLSVHNGVVNDGVITVGPDGQFLIDAGALGGGGETVLTDSIGTNATFQGAPSGGNPCCVTHAATHTIRGEGTVFGKIVNDGVIRAEEASGDSAAMLTISGTMTNNGVIRSSATGSLLLTSLSLTMGATGQLIADTQPIRLGSATIVGGSIDAMNGAKFVHAELGTPVLSGVTLNGDLDVLVSNGGVTGIGPGITNNGTMTIDNLGVADGRLNLESGATLDGTGQVILNRENTGTRINGNFTHGVAHTIRGVGVIQVTIVNDGSILAEPKNGSVLRVINSAFTNNNLLQANSGATFRFEQQSVVTQGAAGRIRAADGGRVELRDNATITGGKLQTAGTGLIVDTSSSTLNNVTNEGEFHVQAGSTTRVNTTLTNNGTITVNPTGVASGAVLRFESNTTLQGTGSIVLNNTGNNSRITSGTGSVIITQAAGHTIRGNGLIDNGFGSGKFVNHGRLEGNSAAEPLGIFTRLSGDGVLKDVTIGGGFVQIQHILGEIGTTAVVPLEGLYGFGRNSSLLVDLAGTTPGTSYDQLSSSGPITLSSTVTRLEVSLGGGFLPLPGDSFTLLTTTDELTGNFGTVALPTLPLGLSWIQSQTSTSFSIGVTGSFAADFDEDDDVDADDLAQWEGDFGGPGSDADGDGDTDGRDFLVWQRQFGLGVQPPVDLTAVPEPQTLCTTLVLFGLATFPRRRSKVGSSRRR